MGSGRNRSTTTVYGKLRSLYGTAQPAETSSATRSTRSMTAGGAAIVALGLLLSGCTNPGKTALGENVPLKPAPDLAGAATPGVVIWRAPDLAQERVASAYLIPPVQVYHGRGSWYSDLSQQDVDQIAANMTQIVRSEVGRHFKVTNTAGPGVVAINLTLAKITPPHANYTPVGPFSEEVAADMPAGQGTMAGTLTVSGKFVDSDSGKLRVGFVAPVSPQVMDLPRPGNPARALDFANVASQQFANDLVNAMIRQRQNSRMATPQ